MSKSKRPKPEPDEGVTAADIEGLAAEAGADLSADLSLDEAALSQSRNTKENE